MTQARWSIGITLFLGLVFSPLVASQQVERVRRVGFLSAPTPSAEMINAFRQGIRENGHVEGRSIQIEWRSVEGKDERLPSLAAELVNLKAEVIVTFASTAALAAKRATTTIPIVFTQVGDPVGAGLVASLARPGANVTGLTNFVVDLTAKRLELTRDAVPGLKSVAILSNPSDLNRASSLSETETAAGRLRLEARVVDARHPGELQPAFTTIAQSRVRPVSRLSDLPDHRLIGSPRALARSAAASSERALA